MSQHYDALMSYTRFDDQHHQQYLTTFREHLSGEVQAHTGKPFRILQDIEDIKWGEQFEARICTRKWLLVRFSTSTTIIWFVRLRCFP
jgi:hypothetical protein